MKILINGSSGYLGKNLKKFVEFNGHQVSVVSKDSHINAKNYFNLTSNSEYHLEKKNYDIFIFIAFDFDKKDDVAIQIQRSKLLLDEALKMNVKKIFYISSLSSFKNAKSNYGKIKFEIERHALKIGAICLRPGLLYGNENSRLFNNLKNISRFRVIPLLGKGNQVLYLTNIFDLFVNLERLIENFDINKGKVLIAANSKPYTIKELIVYLNKESSEGKIFFHVPIPIVKFILRILSLVKINSLFDHDNLLGLIFSSDEIAFNTSDESYKVYRDLVKNVS